jgi:hypothetical protein
MFHKVPSVAALQLKSTLWTTHVSFLHCFYFVAADTSSLIYFFYHCCNTPFPKNRNGKINQSNIKKNGVLRYYFIQVINRKISIYLNQSCQQYSLKSQRKYNNIYSTIVPSKFGTKVSTWFIVVIKINIIVFQRKIIKLIRKKENPIIKARPVTYQST